MYSLIQSACTQITLPFSRVCLEKAERRNVDNKKELKRSVKYMCGHLERQWARANDTHTHSRRSRMFLCSLLSGLPQLKHLVTPGWQQKKEATGKGAEREVPAKG